MMLLFCQTLCVQEDLTKETLQKQFKIVKSHTNTSHVQQFGNKVCVRACVFEHFCASFTSPDCLCFFPSPQTISHMKVSKFQASSAADGLSAPPVSLQPITDMDLTPSPDVPLAILKRKMMASNDIRESREMLTKIGTHFKVRMEKDRLSTGHRTAVHQSLSLCLSVCRSVRYWM